MAATASLINELKSMASPFMGTIITLLSTMQATIDEQKQRIESLEKHCGIEFTPSAATTTSRTTTSSTDNNDITLNISDGVGKEIGSDGSKSPTASTTRSSSNNNDDSKTSDAPTPATTRQKSNNKKSKDKDTKSNSRQSRMERLAGGRGGAKSREASARGGARGARSRSARGGAGAGAGRGNRSESNAGGSGDLVDATDSEYKLRNLNLIFKTFKEEAIKLQGNGKTCKKLDMQNGSCQFGKDILYETDFESNNILKYRVIFDTKGCKITSGAGFGICFIDNFNQWNSRNSGNNNSFHIRGDGKTFLSDHFEIINDSFENGKATQLVKSEGNLVCCELNLQLFQFKVWNLTLARENAVSNSEEFDHITIQINESKKNKKLGFIVYLGGGKSKTLSVHSATAFYAK